MGQRSSSSAFPVATGDFCLRHPLPHLHTVSGSLGPSSSFSPLYVKHARMLHLGHLNAARVSVVSIIHQAKGVTEARRYGRPFEPVSRRRFSEHEEVNSFLVAARSHSLPVFRLGRVETPASDSSSSEESEESDGEDDEHPHVRTHHRHHHHHHHHDHSHPHETMVFSTLTPKPSKKMRRERRRQQRATRKRSKSKGRKPSFRRQRSGGRLLRQRTASLVVVEDGDDHHLSVLRQSSPPPTLLHRPVEIPDDLSKYYHVKSHLKERALRLQCHSTSPSAGASAPRNIEKYEAPDALESDKHASCLPTAISTCFWTSEHVVVVGDERGYVHFLPRLEEGGTGGLAEKRLAPMRPRRDSWKMLGRPPLGKELSGLLRLGDAYEDPLVRDDRSPHISTTTAISPGIGHRESAIVEANSSWHSKIAASRRSKATRQHCSSSYIPMLDFFRLGDRKDCSTLCSIRRDAIDFWDVSSLLHHGAHAAATEPHSHGLRAWGKRRRKRGVPRPAHLGFVPTPPMTHFNDAALLSGTDPHGDRIVYSSLAAGGAGHPALVVFDVNKAESVSCGQTESTSVRELILIDRVANDPRHWSMFVAAGSGYMGREDTIVELYDVRTRMNLTGSLSAFVPAVISASIGSSEEYCIRSLNADFDNRLILGTSFGSMYCWDVRNHDTPVWISEGKTSKEWIKFFGNDHTALALSRKDGLALDVRTGKTLPLFQLDKDWRASSFDVIRHDDHDLHSHHMDDRISFLLADDAPNVMRIEIEDREGLFGVFRAFVPQVILEEVVL